jgi:hypothetical protein
LARVSHNGYEFATFFSLEKDVQKTLFYGIEMIPILLMCSAIASQRAKEA